MYNIFRLVWWKGCSNLVTSYFLLRSHKMQIGKKGLENGIFTFK